MILVLALVLVVSVLVLATSVLETSLQLSIGTSDGGGGAQLFPKGCAKDSALAPFEMCKRLFFKNLLHPC